MSSARISPPRPRAYSHPPLCSSHALSQRPRLAPYSPHPSQSFSRSQASSAQKHHHSHRVSATRPSRAPRRSNVARTRSARASRSASHRLVVLLGIVRAGSSLVVGPLMRRCFRFVFVAALPLGARLESRLQEQHQENHLAVLTSFRQSGAHLRAVACL